MENRYWCCAVVEAIGLVRKVTLVLMLNEHNLLHYITFIALKQLRF